MTKTVVFSAGSFMPLEPLFEVAAVSVESMHTRDGVRLDADVYRPITDEALPVLLMRQPYGRRIASTVTYAHPSWYAARGYVVVIQDVRGRGSSAGAFDLLVHERDDGADTLDWVANLAGSNGRVGMYGFSYQGLTQLLAAASGHEALAAICPAMAPFDLRADMAYDNDVFCAARNIGWAAQLGAESARRSGDDTRYRDLYALGHATPIVDLIDPRNTALRERLAGTHYDDWLNAPADSDYWAARSPSAQLTSLDQPALFIGGWFDGFLGGTLKAYRDLPGDAPRQLHIGPWGHLPWTPHVGDQDMGRAADGMAIDALQLHWFDRFLKDADNGVEQLPNVRLFDLARCDWQRFDAWPADATEKHYLNTDALRRDGGHLHDQPGTGGCRIVHDPWRPVSDSGHYASKTPGPRQRNAIEAQPDVACYVSEPLTADRMLAGDVCLSIVADADTPSFDVHATLARVDRDGVSRNIAHGVRRGFSGDTGEPIVIDLRAVCARFAAGDRLAVSLAGAAFPALELNDGRDSGAQGCADAAALSIITLAFADGEHSFVSLPWVGAEA
ncbi:dipeptidyl-peptidase 4 protein [Salinisphaera shabanensis E1L3A]|uniref:Dipeptidyl-peptidase 4 protein n=1 Tax=Salinisphaera shabanensis E1L3A TaxID=1033802 RepID=U2FUJ8_9GAMM|nr:CocE/NonD family hydrolase [Salinisphaera shabanensis]ERJ19619.1 dipeptidyl-peptidase 4 protein [Salinisphaera shabanensis E1L3A]